MSKFKIFLDQVGVYSHRPLINTREEAQEVADNLNSYSNVDRIASVVEVEE